jgi:antitoxin component YwqK of YwqJK toxin-antitoxin module
MIPRILIIFFCIGLSITGLSQARGKDTVIRYFDGQLEPVKKKEAMFVGVIIKDDLGWNALIYDDSMRILMRGKYADEDCKIKDGWFMYYYTNGKRASGGKFSRNIRTDNWKAWYSNEQLKDSFNFVNGAAEGEARSYFEHGQLASVGTYHAGNFEGRWDWYHENGKPSTREVYKNGKLADLECFDSLGNSQGMNCAISRPPQLVGKYGGIEKFIKDSVHAFMESNKKGIEGVVMIGFLIDKQGVMDKFRVLFSDNPLLSMEAERLVKSVKAWYPAMQHNRLVDYIYTLRIPFYRETLDEVIQYNPIFEPPSWDN